MEATFQTQGKAETRLTQTWDKGKTWWRESIRHVNGRKVFHAKLVSVDSREKLEEWLRKDINRDNPTVQDVLAAVRDATGVQVSLDGTLESHQPFLGSVQMRETPAWVLMKFIASKLQEGQWEHFEGGYRLKAGGAFPPSGQQEPGLTWLWLTAGSLSVALAMIVLLRIRSGSRKEKMNK